MLTFFNYLLIFNFFTGGFVFNKGVFDFYISYIFFVIFLIFYIYRYGNISISRNFICLLIAIFSISLLNILLGKGSLFLMVKTMIAFLFIGTVYYLFIRMNDYEIDKLFRIYMRVACIIALIGIFQEACYFLHFEKGYNFRYFIPRIVPPFTYFGILRITSILPEPAHFGAIMSPALFVSVLNIVQKESYFISKRMSWLILTSVLLSFSLIAYLGIVISLFFVAFNYRKLKLIAFCLAFVLISAFFSYQYLPMIKVRVDDTIAVLREKKLEGKNLSTFAFYTNAYIAYKSFLNSPLIGSGLGSHPISYDQYIAEIYDPAKIWCPLNRTDASGLLFRIISELGLFGVIWFFWFMAKFYVSKTKDNYFWIISNAIFCLFILNLLRQGNYFYGGFLFFAFSYYFLGKSIVRRTPKTG